METLNHCLKRMEEISKLLEEKMKKFVEYLDKEKENDNHEDDDENSLKKFSDSMDRFLEDKLKSFNEKSDDKKEKGKQEEVVKSVFDQYKKNFRLFKLEVQSFKEGKHDKEKERIYETKIQGFREHYTTQKRLFRKVKNNEMVKEIVDDSGDNNSLFSNKEEEDVLQRTLFPEIYETNDEELQIVLGVIKKSELEVEVSRMEREKR